MIALEFKTTDEKLSVYDQVSDMLRKNGAWGAILVNESWWVSPPEGMPKSEIQNIVPSEHPERKEAIALMLTTCGLSEGYIIPFSRDGKKIRFDAEEGPISIEQRLLRVFEEGVQ